MNKGNYNTWSLKEIKILKEYYPISSKDEIIRFIPKHPYGCIINKASKLNIKKNKETKSRIARERCLERKDRYLWTKKEIKYITDNYKKLDDKELAIKLGRTRIAVFKKRLEFKLFRCKENTIWTKEKEKYLIKNYKNISNSKISKEIDISIKSISYKAKSLGLKKSSEYLSKLGKEKIIYIPKNMSQILKKLYREGKIIPPMKGKKMSKESKEKLRQANIGKRYDDEINMKKGLKGKLHPFYGKKLSPKIIRKISKAKKGIKLSQRHKINIGKALKKKWENREYREKVIKNTLKGLFKRPTSLEKKFEEFIKKNKLNYRYVGNGSFLIGYKNPDFINCNGKKVCIEVFYSWFKVRDYGSIKNYEEIRSKYFEKYGWKTIFIEKNLLEKKPDMVLDIIRNMEGT